MENPERLNCKKLGVGGSKISIVHKIEIRCERVRSKDEKIIQCKCADEPPHLPHYQYNARSSMARITDDMID